MKQYLFEIVLQKRRLLGIIAALVLLNAVLGTVVSSYQLPELASLQTRWSDLRRKAARPGGMDVASLHRQAFADLEKLKERIPEKRHFGRVLSDLLEDAAGSAVEIGSINYRPVQIKEESLLSYQLSLSVNGSYAAVKSFLSDIQKNPELIVVDTVSFTNSSLFEENVVMDLKITVYLREGA